MHQPVLVREVVDLLDVRSGGTYIDATVGGGGHAEAILEKTGSAGFVLGIDLDDEALTRAGERLRGKTGTVKLLKGNYRQMAKLACVAGVEKADGVLVDLGISSDQIGDRGRGFSFSENGPLDMRIDRAEGTTAAELVNGLSEDVLADILRCFGEEKRSRRIAGRIAEERAREPIVTTGRLAEIVAEAAGGRRGRIHPATRTFQALRIAVNDELSSLETGLSSALEVLKEGGRMAVIAFHSLEDRIVKNFFRTHAGRWKSLPGGGSSWEGETPGVTILTKKPVRASGAEVRDNPRARSAKLRAAAKLGRSRPSKSREAAAGKAA
ncbi:MAG: 16S rRNA (cytosine(1402)-N(4))-methyltransferase RsmH [Kiritimatiellia bacterium]